jgi:hypothetical protein
MNFTLFKGLLYVQGIPPYNAQMLGLHSACYLKQSSPTNRILIITILKLNANIP